MLTIKAIGHYSDGTSGTLKKASWTSSAPAIVSGRSRKLGARGLAVGTTTITVVDDATGLSASGPPRRPLYAGAAVSNKA